ncbi:MAG: hypothetical protein H9535_19725 [Ignavibacteria bacterium]|nr:hypothetical protein [Ignavibacteria bacterium]MBL7990399.1 hypothetical protein [Candidatus Kapabacteria bacterium]
MTLNEITDFAEAHGCGDFTLIALDVAGKEMWCGVPKVTEGRIVLPAIDEDVYLNLNTLQKYCTLPNCTIAVLTERGELAIKGLARGATPNGAAKAIILQA